MNIPLVRVVYDSCDEDTVLSVLRRGHVSGGGSESLLFEAELCQYTGTAVQDVFVRGVNRAFP
jgi:dTDP-4-amino-4,6-dideoxygalactose transaminase